MLSQLPGVIVAKEAAFWACANGLRKAAHRPGGGGDTSAFSPFSIFQMRENEIIKMGIGMALVR